MESQALICDKNQKFTMETVHLNRVEPDQIGIRTHYTGVSIGTEFALIRGKIQWSPESLGTYPLCTGYMGSGIVESVGTEIDNFKIGDQVYFRGNAYMQMKDGTHVSCVSGAHCSHIVLNPNTTHGAAHLPDGASMETTSMFVMPAVALYGVDMANPRMGQTVVVHGTGLIGLGVVAACSNRGCTVVAVDLSPKRLEVARKMGADYLICAEDQDVETEVMNIISGGADCVFECTGSPDCIDSSIRLCRQFGSFVWQGHYGSKPIEMDFSSPHGRRLQMFFPCDDGWQPCRRAVVKNIAMGTLQWEHCISHRISWKDSPDMFDGINRSANTDIVGVVIDWTN